ncbi:class I SAM-dependent methyltransferase [Desulfobacterota bacterium AH_259_B03_O07]|nr:class I SAM-dependent methyltransferase [Desulfobacterota bacterium AH_259_B03_O07]
MENQYTLKLCEGELERYKHMAGTAKEGELDSWRKAGILPGARAADIGCGPGAILVELARLIEPGGSIVGVEPDTEARSIAAEIISKSGQTNIELISGDAESTRLVPSSFDVVMIRHVLLHNGPRTKAILKHVKSLIKSTGHLYLCETDLTGYRQIPFDNAQENLWNRWLELLTIQGNDIQIGPKIGHLMVEAGLELVERGARFSIVDLNSGFRPTAWAAKMAIIDAGLAGEEDFEKWEDAYQKYLDIPGEKLLFVPHFWAVGSLP